MNAGKAAFLAAARDSDFANDAPGAAGRATLREIVARQIDEDDPPDVWQTAQRLKDHVLAVADVTRQLVLTHQDAHDGGDRERAGR